MGIARLVLGFVLLSSVLLAALAQAESHYKEHYKPDKHLLREKKAKEHHAFFHNDKQLNKPVRKSYKSVDGPHHEEKMQRDVSEPQERERKDEAWHKKDMHLQDLSYEPHKSHHSGHSQHHTKSHHTWAHHTGKHTTDHNKGKEASTEHGYLHKPHKATPSTFDDKPVLTKSLKHNGKEHSRPHKSEEAHQMHFLTNKKPKSATKDHYWSKNKKQKDKKATHDKKQKPKLHRKKLSRGELHKLW